MDLILKYKWTILLVLEIMAWALTFLMLYARYWMQSRLLFQLCTVLYALVGIIPQVTLGILNFWDTGEIDVFTLIIVALILYGFTIGKEHVRRLDAWAQERVSRRRQKIKKKNTNVPGTIACARDIAFLPVLTNHLQVFQRFIGTALEVYA